VGSVGSGDGRFSSLSVEMQRVYQGASASKSQEKLKPSPEDNFLRRIGHTLLREKVFYFSLGAFLLLPLGVLGLFRFFEYPDWKTRRRGLALAACVFPLSLGAFLYGAFW